MHADTNIEGEGCRQCERLELDLEREHRRYIDSSRLADERRKELAALRGDYDSACRHLKDALERATNAESKLNSFGPLKPPSEQAREVFAKVIETTPDADMRAIPNQWLLNERGVSQVFSDNIATLESRLDACIAERDEARRYVDGMAELIMKRDAEIERQGCRLGELQKALESAGGLIGGWTSHCDYRAEPDLRAALRIINIALVERQKPETGPYDEVYEKGMKWLDENG